MASLEENLKLAKKLSKFDIWLKVGLRAYLRDGYLGISKLKEINSNFKIFLDLKLYDIPNTIADAAYVCAKLDIDMINIHASAGEVAMRAVMQRLESLPKRPLVLAVSALTSFNESEFYKIYGSSIDEKVKEFAKMSHKNGLDGMVCSIYENSLIKAVTSPNFLTLTPGIRPFKEAKDDQERVATLEDVKQEKPDFIVVGRAIYKSNEPEIVVGRILEELKLLKTKA